MTLSDPKPRKQSTIIYDFSYEALPADDAKYLRDEAAYINARRHLTHQLISEMGAALIRAKERLPGVFLTWARTEFQFSDDTIENYMNVARNLPALPDNAPSTMFQARALYKLAGAAVSDETRAAAGKIAESGQVVDYEVAYILADAPIEIKERYLSETLTKSAAFNLARILNKKTTPPAVRAACLSEKVNSPELVEYLAQAYIDEHNGKGRTTWTDIQRDGFILNGFGWSVPIAEARVVDIERFKVDRAQGYIDNAPKNYQWLEVYAPVQKTPDGRSIIVIDRKDFVGLDNQALMVKVRVPIKGKW